MGYSYSTKAGLVQDAMIIQLKSASNREIESSNTWEHNGHDYFIEQGREQRDGSITGTVWRMNPVEPGSAKCTCHKVGSIKIEPHGHVLRWPTSTKAMRIAAESAGMAEYAKIYTPRQSGPFTFVVA